MMDVPGIVFKIDRPGHSDARVLIQRLEKRRRGRVSAFLCKPVHVKPPAFVRLMAVIRDLKGSPNKELRAFERQVTKLAERLENYRNS